MSSKFSLVCVGIVKSSLGLIATMLFTVGVTSSLIGVSGKAVEKVAEALEPYKPLIQPLINYGTAGAFLGLFVGGCGVFISKTVETHLIEEELYQDALIKEQEWQENWLLCLDANRNCIEESLREQAEDIGEVLGTFNVQNFSELNLPENLRDNHLIDQEFSEFNLPESLRNRPNLLQIAFRSRTHQYNLQEIEKKFKAKKPLQCYGCLFYSENEYLRCAVNPQLSEGCQHFETEIKL